MSAIDECGIFIPFERERSEIVEYERSGRQYYWKWYSSVEEIGKFA
jgi:hypothetical protein